MKILLKAASLKARGVSVLSLLIYVVAAVTITGGAFFLGPSVLNTAKTFNLNSDFASLKTAAMQLMYETNGLTSSSGGEFDFAATFNRYVDTSAALTEAGQLKLEDPWGMGYFVTFERVSGSESKILIESRGKYAEEGIPSHALLIHYKYGEVRSGTSGFNADEGAETSDASYSDSEGATITTMFADVIEAP